MGRVSNIIVCTWVRGFESEIFSPTEAERVPAEESASAETHLSLNTPAVNRSADCILNLSLLCLFCYQEITRFEFQRKHKQIDEIRNKQTINV